MKRLKLGILLAIATVTLVEGICITVTINYRLGVFVLATTATPALYFSLRLAQALDKYTHSLD